MLAPRVLTTVGRPQRRDAPVGGPPVDGAAAGALPARPAAGRVALPVVGGHHPAGWAARTPPWSSRAWCFPGCCSSSPTGGPGDAGCGTRSPGAAWSSWPACGGSCRCSLMGAYAPPFLDFIESAHNTASQHRLADLAAGHQPLGGVLPRRRQRRVGGRLRAWLFVGPARHDRAGGRGGLLGLAQPGLWARRVLVAIALVGLAVLTLGSAGWPAPSCREGGSSARRLAGAAAQRAQVRPVVRLPLSLGVGAFVSVGLPALLVRIEVVSARPARTGPRRRDGCSWSRPAGGRAAGRVRRAARRAAGCEDISASWQRGGRVPRQPGRAGKALVLPGSGFAVQDWGRTIDEPIQVLGAPPWLARAQVTVAPAGDAAGCWTRSRTRWRRGGRSAGLARRLRRLGITHVVVRNDLAVDETDAPPSGRRLRLARRRRPTSSRSRVSDRGRRASAGRGLRGRGRRRGPPRSGHWTGRRAVGGPGRPGGRRRPRRAPVSSAPTRPTVLATRPGRAGRHRHRQQPARRAILRTRARRPRRQ